MTARTDGEGNLVEASENGTDYHYTHDTEGRVLSKQTWGKTLYENHYDAEGYRDSIIQFRMLGLKNGQKKWNKL